MNIIWVLSFLLNGHLVIEKPRISEACILHMLQKTEQQKAVCTNSNTGEQIKWIK